MARKRQFNVSSRKWLNPVSHEDSGAIQWHVTCDNVHSIDAYVTIWDCGRKITLSLNCYGIEGVREAKQRAQKINLLIEELTKMKQALGEAYDFRESLHNETTFEPYDLD